MTGLGHIGGVPVEELLPALAGSGASLLLARAWLAARFRHREDERRER